VPAASADYLRRRRAQKTRESISLLEVGCASGSASYAPGSGRGHDPVWHDSATNSARIPLRFGRLRLLFAALGITPGSSYLDVAPDLVCVRMSWAFRADVPRPSIRAVRRVRNSVSIGVHGWGGRWLVNGAAGPLVAVAIDPPAPARTLGLPVRLRELIVSVEDPAALIAELRPVPAAEPA
jgi:hypothetical protein